MGTFPCNVECLPNACVGIFAVFAPQAHFLCRRAKKVGKERRVKETPFAWVSLTIFPQSDQRAAALWKPERGRTVEKKVQSNRKRYRDKAAPGMGFDISDIILEPWREGAIRGKVVRKTHLGFS